MVIRARGWDESANALASASDRVTIKGRKIELLNCTYLAIQGIVFETDVTEDHRVIYMSRCSHCRITQCEFHPVETNLPRKAWTTGISEYSTRSFPCLPCKRNWSGRQSN